MKKVVRIDTKGFFIEDVILQDNEPIPSDCKDVVVPDGFYKPKLDRTTNTIVEGLTQDEINAIKSVVQTPSIEDRISALEQLGLSLI